MNSESNFGGPAPHAGGCLKIWFCWISAHRIPTIDCVDTGDCWNILESCCPSLEARIAVQLTIHFLLTCHLSTSNYPLLGLFQQGPPMPKFGDSVSEPLVPLSFQVCPTPSVWWVWVPAQAQNLYSLSCCWSSSIVRLKPQVSTWQSHGWRGEICEFPHGPLKKMPIRGKFFIPNGSYDITIVSIPYIWYLTKLHVLLIVLHIHLQLTVVKTMS